MVVAAALLLLPLAGCDSDARWADMGPSATAPTTETTETTETSRTTATTTTTTTTTAPVPEVAADGTNLAACEDGTCEVEIKSGDMLTIRGEQFTVVSVSPEGMTMVLPSGTVASLGGTGTISTASGTQIEVLRNKGATVLIRVS